MVDSAFMKHVARVLAEHPRPMTVADIAAEVAAPPDIVELALRQGYEERRFDTRTLTIGVSRPQEVWSCRPTATVAPERPPPPGRSMLAFLRRPEPAPAPPKPADPGELRDQLLDACRDADDAAKALELALQRRREAMLALQRRYPIASSGKAMLNRAFTPYSTWRALCAHGLQDLLALQHVATPHRQSFVEQALSLPAAPVAVDHQQQETV